VRIFNIFFVSLIPAIWWSNGLRRKDEFKTVFFIISFLVSIWMPFFIFSFRALAESLSFLFLNLLLLSLLKFYSEHKKQKIDFASMSILALELSALFFLKANNIFVAIPVGLYIIFLRVGKIKKGYYVFLFSLL
jgi:hypothetical protein